MFDSAKNISFLNGSLSFLAGAVVLSLFSFIEKQLSGASMVLESYIACVMVGGSSGLIMGVCWWKLKRDHAEMEYLTVMLRTICSMNLLLIKEGDRSRLLRYICEAMIETLGYCKAWIALLDDSKKLVVSAESGLGEGFLRIVDLMERGQLPRCAQAALSQAGVVVFDNPVLTCSGCPLAKDSKGRGVLTVRLEYAGRIYGLVSVAVPVTDVSDKRKQGLLEDVAAEIGFGLYRMTLHEERKQTEQALQRSEKQFRDLVENSLTGIFIIQNAEILYRNPEQKKYVAPLAQLFKSEDFSGIHPEDTGKVKQFYQKIISGEVQTLDTDLRFYPISEVDSRLDVIWVYCRASLIEYQGEDAILFNVMDITRAKELEHLLRIQDKMTSLGRVAAGIAHEIRNPLSGINIYLNTLEKMFNKPEQSKKVQEIFSQLKSASRKIESVIRRVMDFSKPSSPKFVKTNLNQPVNDAIQLSSAILRKSGINIEKSLTRDLPMCHADPHLIEEVILNLVTNAAEAMKTAGGTKRMAITSSIENGSIVLRVSDSGPGIPLNRRDKIFDPFYTTKSVSTGIGLSLCHRIITDHGGSMAVMTSKWGGAEFVIEIPMEKGKDRR